MIYVHYYRPHICTIVCIYIYAPKLWSKNYSTLYVYSIYTYIQSRYTWWFIPLIPLDQTRDISPTIASQLPNLLVLVLFAAPEAQWLGGRPVVRTGSQGRVNFFCSKKRWKKGAMGKRRNIIYIHGGLDNMSGFPHRTVSLQEGILLFEYDIRANLV